MEGFVLFSAMSLQDFVYCNLGIIDEGKGHSLELSRYLKQNINENGNLPLEIWENGLVLAWMLEVKE